MKLRWVRFTLIGVQGLLVALWVLNAARHLSRPHTDWSAVLDPPLLITLVAVSTLAPPAGLAVISEGRVSRRRVAVVSGIAVAVALAAFVAGYYASRAG